jgi:beta-glucosidase-like glycosyl hydrolase
MPAKVDTPGRIKRMDDALDHILKLRRKAQKELAKQETERAATEWIAQYVATMALTMQHATLEAREAACTEILNTLRDAGLWPPAEIPDEPTA